MAIFNALVATVALFGTAQAFQSINITQNVTAGQNTTVTIVNDDNDTNAVNYTVALYTAVQNFPICTLITSLPISATQFSVSIPPSVGPSGFYYRIDLVSFDSTGNPIFPAPTYTDLFFLQHGTGVLSSYEIPAPNALIGDTFYGSSSLPCEAYDCARQCARADPPSYDEDGGVSGAGQTVYDSRYISCLEACPGVSNPIAPDTFASTTTGTGSLPTVTPVASAANQTCNADNGMTPCGGLCCGQGQACWHWGSCEDVDEVDGTSTTTTRAGATKTHASSTAKSTADSTGTAPAGSTTTAKSDAGRVQASLFLAGIVALVGFYLQA